MCHPARPVAGVVLRAGAVLLLAGYVALLGQTWIVHGHSWFLAPDGRPAPTDFAAYRVAGTFALNGDAGTAYDWERFSEALAVFLGRELEHWLGWLNPPIFLLVVAPLASLPYEGSALLWIGLTGAAYAAAARLALPGHAAILPALAAPATLASVIKGQNGLLSAALISFGLMLLARRPVLAGACIGALSYKPHFGLVLPLLLLLTHQFRAFLAAAATVLGLALLSALAFGVEAWAQFLGTIGGTADRFLLRGSGLAAMQSVYALLAPHAGHRIAMAAHGAAAIAAFVACAVLWRHRAASQGTRAAAAMAATFLATPYVFNHDAPMLTIAALLLARGEPSRPPEPVDLALLCIATLLFGATLFTQTNLAGPIAAVTLLGVAWRRSAPSPRPG